MRSHTPAAASQRPAAMPTLPSRPIGSNGAAARGARGVSSSSGGGSSRAPRSSGVVAAAKAGTISGMSAQMREVRVGLDWKGRGRGRPCNLCCSGTGSCDLRCVCRFMRMCVYVVACFELSLHMCAGHVAAHVHLHAQNPCATPRRQQTSKKT